MKKGIFLVMCFVFLTFTLCLAQSKSTAEPATPETETPTPEEAQTQWVWGEVVSVDTVAKTIAVKYLDYETDQEKEIILETSPDATYENVSSFEEIMAKDLVSVDYIVSPEGKNIARNISVEKQEFAPAVEEAMPEETEPDKPVEE
ncbi:MAG: hypothetical protein NC916_02525 [Candidatus Omnitrophica bacterium]|nr:hypothetical protein [Candidatus Omnitrophota bacterium]